MMKWLIALLAALSINCASIRPFSAARVNIPIVTPKGTFGSAGTAFLIADPWGHERLITAGHVCEIALAGNSTLSLTTVEGRAVVTTTPGSVEVYRIHTEVDLCELKVNTPLPSSLPVLTLADEDAEIEEPLSVDGAPHGVFPVRTHATFMGRTFYDGRFYGVANGFAAPGNSGSPVIDENGRVQGVLVRVASEGPHFLYVPHEELRAFLLGAK